MKPRVTATDRLSNVIEVVEMGRRNGLLSVERGSGSVFEEGEIYFASGRPIYASLAGLRGREALVALSRWGACRFAFESEAPRPAPNITPTDPSLQGRPSNPRLTPSQMGSSYPSPGAGSSGPLGGNDRVPEGSGTWALQTGPNGYPVPNIIAPPPAPAQRDSGNLPPQPYSRPVTPSSNGRPSFAGPSLSPSLASSQPGLGNLGRRPRRAPDVRDLMNIVTAHNLSRSHRTVLLLADGEHTILDLARLSSKSVDEITGLLGDLEARGLVYYYSAE